MARERLTAKVSGPPYGAGGELVALGALRDAWAWARDNLRPGQRLTVTAYSGLVVREWVCGPDGKARLVESSGRRRVG
jgi:hypothetical protein